MKSLSLRFLFITSLFCLSFAVNHVPGLALQDESVYSGEEFYTSGEREQVFPIFSDDMVITGVDNRVESYFEIGQHSIRSGNSLSLVFSHSPTLISGLSYVTVLLDDVPVSSIPLDETNAERTNLQIDLSSYKLEPGFHKVSFLIQMESTLIACENPDSPANWFVIYKESELSLTIVNQTSEFHLAMYPSPFYEKGHSDPMQTIFVIPDNFGAAELGVTAQLVQYFSRQNYADRLLFQVYMESEVTQELLSAHHVIWIGHGQKWNDYGAFAMDSVSSSVLPQDTHSGFIGLIESPWNKQFSNLIISGDDQQINRAGTILSDPSLYDQLRGRYSLLSSQNVRQQNVPDQKLDKLVQVSFSQMGYGDIVLEDTQTGNAFIYYPLPSQWDFQDGALLELVYSHSDSIHLEESTFAVKVNGIPVGSRYLDETSNNYDVLQLELPQNLLEARRTLEIEVQVEFIDQGNQIDEQVVDCSDMSLIGHWFVIDDSSSLQFQPVQRQQFNLQSIPYPFVSDGKWKDTTILIPEQLDTNLLSTMMTWIGQLGRDAYDNGELNFVSMSNDPFEHFIQDQNIIFFGSGDALPPFLQESKQLSVRFEEGHVLSNNEQIQLLNELQTHSTVIQLTESPFQHDHGLLLVATSMEGQIEKAAQAFTDAVENEKISGSFVIVDSDSRVHAFNLVDTIVHSGMEDSELSQPWYALNNVLFCFIFLLVSGTLIIFIRRVLKS